jgi:hypothetical protein
MRRELHFRYKGCYKRISFASKKFSIINAWRERAPFPPNCTSVQGLFVVATSQQRRAKQAASDAETLSEMRDAWRVMSWGINLRTDLAKLSDSDLAAELDYLTRYRSTRFGSAPLVGSFRGTWRYGFGFWPRRGWIYARWAYRARIGYFGPFRGPMGTQYLVECEIEDPA